MYRCPDPPLEPPEHKNAERVTYLLHRIEDAERIISGLEDERDTILPELESTHISGVASRWYESEISYWKRKIAEYNQEINQLMEG